MPKFNIYPQQSDPGADEPARRISVGYTKGSYAQVGIALRLAANPHIAPAAKADGVFNSDPDWHTEWVDADRHTINQLIRELRKARDEAFGRDE